MISQLLGGLVVILVAVALYPQVQQQLDSASTNATGFSSEVIKQTPILFILGIVLTAVLAFVWTMWSGNDESGEFDEVKEKPKPSPDKQTYEEYVRERLKVQDMLK
jgi:glycerol uptake facilitator-like aquaporin